MWFGVGLIFVVITSIFELKKCHDPKTYILTVALTLIIIIFLNYNPYYTILHPNTFSEFVLTLIIPLIYLTIVLVVIYKWKNQKYNIKTVNKTFTTVITVFIIILAMIAGIALAMGDHDNQKNYETTSNMNVSNEPTVNINSTSGHFQNNWVQFDYPSNLTISDYSTNDSIMIEIFNGTNQIGSIEDQAININDLLLSGQFNGTKINGRTAGIGENVQITHYYEYEYLSTFIDDLGENSTSNIGNYNMSRLFKSYIGVVNDIFGVQINGDPETSYQAVVYLKNGSTLNMYFINNSQTVLHQIANTLEINKDDVKNVAQDNNNSNVSFNGTFENQWLKFNYPPGVVVVDRSTDDKIEIEFLKNQDSIGNIINGGGPIPEDGRVIIAGRYALNNTQSTIFLQPMPSSNIALNSDDSLSIGFFSGNETVYNEVINSLIIKKGNETTANPNFTSSSPVINKTTVSFENQWIKFNYSSNLKITDQSSNDQIKIVLSNETQDIGTITSVGMNIGNDSTNQDPNAPTSTVIAGRYALNGTSLSGSEPQPSSYIKLNPDVILSLSYVPDYGDEYNQTINSLVIKRDDIKTNIFLNIYHYITNFIHL
jgi:hypothetical protein